MSGFGTAEIRRAASAAASAIETLKPDLNAADAKLGDGDTGSMLARVLGAIDAQASAAAKERDVGALLTQLARSAASATGSSLGTLLATALLTAGKAAKAQEQVPWSSLGDLLNAAQAAMAARGKAKLGDKTILDMIDAVASAIRGLDDPAEIAKRAVAASDRALADFRNRPNKIGRARMFGEATVGLDDPGMLAVARLLVAIAG